MERTVVLIKPDGVKRGLIGELITRFEKVGLKIVAMKMVWVDEERVGKHYPMDRTEWLTKMGERALKTYDEYGEDKDEELSKMEPLEVGKLMAKWLVDYLVSGPVIAMVLEGEYAVKVVRKLVGHTFSDQALPGTIRGDYASVSGLRGFKVKQAGRNLVHASGNKEEAKYEEELWFKKNEIHKYSRVDEELMFG